MPLASQLVSGILFTFGLFFVLAAMTAEKVLSYNRIKEKAREAGFHACGVSPAGPVSEQRQREWRERIEEHRFGQMHYLYENTEKRLNPALLVEGAKTVVSVALNYNPGNLPQGWHLARYAYSTDYHLVVKDKLRHLMAALGLTENVDGRCFVDTAPVDEKYWAERGGIGWRGRNTQLIIPGMGSYFFLGELVLTVAVDKYDERAKKRCGTCRACIDACPAKALRGNGTMDAERCLSYLTIEHKGELPECTSREMGNCFYGCDRCAEACPWNKRFAHATPCEDLKPREALLQMQPEDWRQLTVEQYRALFTKSAVKRAKYEGLMRNIHALSLAGENEKNNDNDHTV